jgi:molybdopterin-guanine dinucleotide biosynthesis protein A
MMGAVLAGGQSRRFGSDKALAMLGGVPLIERAVAALAPWCDEVVIVGGEREGITALRDWPAPGLGPLGGIAAALRHADARGHAAVLTCGVDSHDLPDDLPQRLSPAPAFLEDQPVIGLWPAAAFGTLVGVLNGPEPHSMRAFAQALGARGVHCPLPPGNINTPEDLAQREYRHGL